MRSDLFTDRKSVHFKISKEVHFALRAKLFKHNISMQELFDEFAHIIVTDAPRGQSIIETVVNKKIKQITGKSPKKKKRESFGEFDSETLYSMINDSGDK